MFEKSEIDQEIFFKNFDFEKFIESKWCNNENQDNNEKNAVDSATQFLINRFYGQWSSQRPRASFEVEGDEGEETPKKSKICFYGDKNVLSNLFLIIELTV